MHASQLMWIATWARMAACMEYAPIQLMHGQLVVSMQVILVERSLRPMVPRLGSYRKPLGRPMGHPGQELQQHQEQQQQQAWQAQVLPIVLVICIRSILELSLGKQRMLYRQM